MLAMGVPLFAVALYFSLGVPKAIDAAALQPPHEQAPVDLQAMVARLDARLQRQPDDVEGWFMLARSYQVLEHWDRAASAYRRAIALEPGDADLLADLADVLAVMAQGNLEGEPRTLLQQAIAADPSHAKSLLLLAAAELRQGRRDEARRHWEALLRSAPADSEAANIARSSLTSLGVTVERPAPNGATDR
jgi:cytochrome c-type biogenesis protein CcmH